MTTTQAGKEAIDLRRFNQVFFEECAEHLAEMEQILISLSDGQPDHEQLNAIFRAAHSIKGGAGIFGFDDMTIVTHVMESLLDRLRNNEITLRAVKNNLLPTVDVYGFYGAASLGGAKSPYCSSTFFGAAACDVPTVWS